MGCYAEDQGQRTQNMKPETGIASVLLAVLLNEPVAQQTAEVGQENIELLKTLDTNKRT